MAEHSTSSTSAGSSLREAATPSSYIPVWRWQRLTRLVNSMGFNVAIAVVIMGNALAIGASTYPGIVSEYSQVLTVLDIIFYTIFVIELILRILSYGRKPWMFFTDPWNVFDFVIITAVAIPAVRERATILRLLRLARIARIVHVLPELNILVRTVVRAIPAVASLLLLTFVIVFVYAIVGWTMFGTALPEDWGTVGSAMITLFVLLTLENFPVYRDEAQSVTPWATVFFLSFVLLGAFVILNLFIGVVVGTMETIREEEHRTRRNGHAHNCHTDASTSAATAEVDPPPLSPTHTPADHDLTAQLLTQMQDLQAALDRSHSPPKVER